MKPVGLSEFRYGLNPTSTTPPCHNNTTLGNRLYAQRKGPIVTNPIYGSVSCEECFSAHWCSPHFKIKFFTSLSGKN